MKANAVRVDGSEIEVQTTPQQRRREATTAEILDAAWMQCRVDGLSSLSMRALAAAVGLKAPTLYSYFDSKNAIYDAMFRQGYEAFAARIAEAPVVEGESARAAFGRIARIFLDFAVEDPTRYQLLFQRVLPDFEPTSASYAVSLDVLEALGAEFRRVGIDDPGALDLWTALSTGLASQQITNDLGGDRWLRLSDRAVDMFFDHLGID